MIVGNKTTKLLATHLNIFTSILKIMELKNLLNEQETEKSVVMFCNVSFYDSVYCSVPVSHYRHEAGGIFKAERTSLYHSPQV